MKPVYDTVQHIANKDPTPMFKNLFYVLLFALTAMLPLTACSSSKAKKALGVGRQSPDEFAVVERAPLTLPPSYQLTPPQPGAPRPQETSTTEQARALITGDAAIKTAGMSSAEATLVQKAGGGDANPEIRSVLNNEYGVVPEGAASDRTIDKLNPFSDGDPTKGKILDPTEEADALREDGVNAPKPVTREEEDAKI